MLNRVQVRFVRLLGIRLGYTFLGTPVAEVEDMFGLQSLSLRRKFLDLVFLNKIVSGVLDCPVILSYIDISIPRGTRSRTIFQRRSMPSYYAYNSSVPRLLRCGSDVAPLIDFFMRPTGFRNELFQIIYKKP
ncbi:hypothetical protein J6590_001578 [Homalodisca vitripennis]|nr:hypothetical protein J6590_001578 [Homalodisca vitripennis]